MPDDHTVRERQDLVAVGCVARGRRAPGGPRLRLEAEHGFFHFSMPYALVVPILLLAAGLWALLARLRSRV